MFYVCIHAFCTVACLPCTHVFTHITRPLCVSCPCLFPLLEAPKAFADVNKPVENLLFFQIKLHCQRPLLFFRRVRIVLVHTEPCLHYLDAGSRQVGAAGFAATLAFHRLLRLLDFGLRCGPLKRCSADNSCAAISHSVRPSGEPGDTLVMASNLAAEYVHFPP